MTKPMLIRRTHAKGKIEVKTYKDDAYEQPADGPALHQLHITESFHGDIEGEGNVEFLQSITPDGYASFVGIERFAGKLAGRSGTFLLQDQGTVKNKMVSGTWFVIPGSGTNELKGLRGDGGFTAQLGKAAEIYLDYWFE